VEDCRSFAIRKTNFKTTITQYSQVCKFLRVELQMSIIGIVNVSNDLDTTLDILSRLVSFNTISSNSNLALVRYVENYLDDLGVAFETIPNEEGSKASILARIGPDEPGGIIFSAHSDVVPVEEQRWSYNPFRMTIDDGRAYGRGTCDMKGFFAAVLAAAPMFLSASLRAPVYFAFSYDEEIGCAGVAPLIHRISEIGLAPSVCIVGEPTLMEPVTAHTGKQIFECEFFGTPMHSSLVPRGRNAISEAVKVLHTLNDFALGLRVQRGVDPRFPIAYPTINVGTIEGGKATNIVAEYCKFVVEYRYPPGAPEGALREELERVFSSASKATGRFQETTSYPSFTASNGSHAVALVTEIASQNNPRAVNYGTEAGMFAEAGIDTVVLGPGDIRQAHQPDEFIEISQLDACDKFFQRLAAMLPKGARKCLLQT
jgi:acetylornithine deacetylase